MLSSDNEDDFDSDVSAYGTDDDDEDVEPNAVIVVGEEEGEMITEALLDSGAEGTDCEDEEDSELDLILNREK